MIALLPLRRSSPWFSPSSPADERGVPRACNAGRMPLARALVALLLLAPPWSWPVAPPHTVVRTYLAPATPYSAGHRGIDLAAPGGAVYAPADGVVHFAGTVVDRPVLSIEHPGGVLTSYEPVVTELVAGAHVERGDVIGTVVAGHCASPCLHFGVRVGGEYASPLAWLGGLEPAVLLPTRRTAVHQRAALPGSTSPPGGSARICPFPPR